ncbi:hypothetical protein GCM10008018_39190 [Paenibacillus marchantiophytorum]|uniref:Uncharacterized protein n=1 Tax=Paenibacillus marchantiophytorum TaxID=1619310 RepID=A0ABQ1EX01_9BACL|nr:hypothetical protein GCM10008018_39190 [Paenibacillus marchantiophytorum]
MEFVRGWLTAFRFMEKTLGEAEHWGSAGGAAISKAARREAAQGKAAPRGAASTINLSHSNELIDAYRRENGYF